jgi:predicted metalloprotease with PDZ domain
MNVTVTAFPDSFRALIEGTSAPATKWSFLDSYAGLVGLGGRIENFALADAGGSELEVHKIAPGQFQSSKPATRFRYEVNLGSPLRGSDAAMTSWLTKDRGLLVLADLLPNSVHQNPDSITGRVRLKLMDGWRGYSTEAQLSQNEFEIRDVANAVFAIGLHLRSADIIESGMTVRLVTDSDWAFSDQEARELIARVFKAHRDTFGAVPSKQGSVILFPFPQSSGGSNWTAETRGSTVTLLLGKLPSRVGALAQLSTPLTHELFHLWVPNGLALEGNYDWFYEGFTVYQAARTAVRLDLLTFPEFLTAIGRAYDGYLNSIDRDRWSLIEASERRWTAGQTSVYAKSMVVAFLYDLKLRSQSRGKRSVDDVYRKVFQGYRSPEGGGSNAKPGDGNRVIIETLAGDVVMQDFVHNFITQAATINLSQELSPYGLTVETVGLRTRVAVGEQLSKQQRDLLRQLGYNDATRTPRRSLKD